MDHYQPTFESKETARNIEDFIEATRGEFWKIFKPLMPFIAACHILDAVISDLFFAESKSDFALFGILAAYFVTVLVITWHRVVIHGPDNYTSMNPFKPKRHELVFIGMGFLIAVVFGAIAVGTVVGAVVIKSLSAVIPTVALVLFCVLIYLSYRVCFYFPARAVNSGITLSQAFRLTKGYLWKIISSTFRASFYSILMIIAFVLAMGVLLALAFMFLPLPISGNSEVLSLLVTLPLKLYFEPLLTVIGVTALSNYYLYAVQNDNEAVKG